MLILNIFLVTLSVLLPVYCEPVNISAYDYHEKVGIPKATELWKFEEDSYQTRIVGGAEASLGSLYYQAGLLVTLTTGWQSVCGGSLISNTRILTAAHCWWDGQNQAAQITVVLGSVRLYTGGTRIVTKESIVHPSWNPEDILYDIALLKIASVSFNNNIQYIPLPPSSAANNDFSGLTGIASGYGKKSDAENIAPATATLHFTNLQIISNIDCQRSFDMLIHNSHLCTSGVGGVGTCDGDSGGPLTVTIDNSRVLVGIASFGLSDGCQSGVPSVFTRVTALLPWINSNL